MSLISSSVAEVFVRDYLLSASTIVDIIRRLERSYLVLKNVEQDDHDKLPPGIDNIALQLVHDKLLKHKSKVRCILYTHHSKLRVFTYPHFTLFYFRRISCRKSSY